MSEFVVEFVLLFLVCGWTTLSMTLGGLGGSMFSLLESGGGGGGGGAPTDGIVQRRRETVHGGARERVEILLQNQRRRPDGEIQGESHRERVAIAREHAQAEERRRRSASSSWCSSAWCTWRWSWRASTTKISRRFTTTITGRYALVFIRIAFAMLFIVAGGSTYATAKSQDAGLASFIRNLPSCAAWLLAFPFVIFTASSVPLIWKERYVAASCAFLQCTASPRWVRWSSWTIRSRNSVPSVRQRDPVRLGRHGFRAKVAID